MSRKSAAGYPIVELQFNDCVVCHYCKKRYFVRTIGNHWRYCEAYINQCLGDDKTEKFEQEKKRRDQLTRRYHQRKPLEKLNSVLN